MPSASGFSLIRPSYKCYYARIFPLSFSTVDFSIVVVYCCRALISVYKCKQKHVFFPAPATKAFFADAVAAKPSQANITCSFV